MKRAVPYAATFVLPVVAVAMVASVLFFAVSFATLAWKGSWVQAVALLFVLLPMVWVLWATSAAWSTIVRQTPYREVMKRMVRERCGPEGLFVFVVPDRDVCLLAIPFPRRGAVLFVLLEQEEVEEWTTAANTPGSGRVAVVGAGYVLSLGVLIKAKPGVILESNDGRVKIDPGEQSGKTLRWQEKAGMFYPGDEELREVAGLLCLGDVERIDRRLQ